MKLLSASTMAPSTAPGRKVITAQPAAPRRKGAGLIAADLRLDRVGHERANAAGEVRRSFEGHYPPLYQLACLTGGRQFYALKAALVDREFTTRWRFYDAPTR